MVCIGTHAGTHHLGIDLGTTGLGVLQFLQDEAAGTLGHDESVAAGAERTAGLLRLVVAGGQGMHGVEATNTCSTDGSLGTTGNDGIGLA